MQKQISALSTDWAVLTHLEMNARASAAEIGRSIGTSKENVINAIHRLERTGVITEYFAVINVARLGFTPYVVYAQIKTASTKERQTIITRLCGIQKIYWVSSMGGKFDVCFGVLARSPREFNESLIYLQRSLNSKLGRIAIHTRLQTIQFPRTYLSDRAPRRAKLSGKELLTFGAGDTSIVLTEREKKLINAISDNARNSVVDIARELSITRATASRILARLEEAKVISGYAANVRTLLLGYQGYRLLIKMRAQNSENTLRLYRFAFGHSNVTYIDMGFGEWDFELTCEVRSSLELQEILSAINSEFVQDVESIELLSVFIDNVKFKFTL